MAIGVFIGVTPTIPLHTVLAVALAFVFRGSKPAAALGVWVSNPITIPFFYFGSYRLGGMLFNITAPFHPRLHSISELFQVGTKITLAMICGGVLLAIPLGLGAYGLTLGLCKRIQKQRQF